MQKETEAVYLYEEQASLVRAMAHPTRLRILEILAQEECCVCHLTAILGQRQPYVSQHLMLLRERGLVLDRKDGVMVHYRLADKRIADILALMRGVLSSLGVTGGFVPVPAAPIHGCTCPKCRR